MDKNAVIIGGGPAAVNAAKAIREVDSEINIHIFQNENVYPYYRIRLTKSLFENIDAYKIALQKKEWYEQNNIKLYLDKEVIKIDTDSCSITLNDGGSLIYDKLLLANGASNFTPPIDGITKKNVYTIRRFENIQAIKANIGDKKTILNIGGGIQGLEAAWALCMNGKEVIIAEALERLMPRQLDKRASEIILKAIESFKVKVLLNTQIEKITGEDEVKGVITKDGSTINCDMILYSVGIRSNKKLVEGTSVKTNFGVVVNEKMETSVENVYSVGDVAELNGRIGGLWNIAVEQGKTAGYNMAGRDTTYTALTPVTMMNAFNVSLFSVGEVDENSCDKTFTDESPDAASYKRIFIKDNKIVGAILIGEAKYSTLLKNAVENKTDLYDIDLSNISFDDLLVKLKSK